MRGSSPGATRSTRTSRRSSSSRRPCGALLPRASRICFYASAYSVSDIFVINVINNIRTRFIISFTWYVLWYIVPSVVYTCDLILARIWLLGLCCFINRVLHYPPDNLHHTPLGSLFKKLGKMTSATPCLENPSAKPFPNLNPLKMMVQASSSLIEFEPRPTSPHRIVLDHDRDTTMIVHDEPLVIGNPWAKKSSEALSLEREEKYSIEEHGSFILESPTPCRYSTPPETATCCTTNAVASCNLLKTLSSKTFRRMVVNAFVYRKHCKFRCCTIALTLQLKHNRRMVVKVGAAPPVDSCRKKPPWSSSWP